MRVWVLGALLALAAPLSAATPWAQGVLDAGFSAYAAGDYSQAHAQFTTLANHGSAIGETMLGTMYARGQGVAPDPATAATYWFRAASRGYAPGQLALARALAAGKGVNRDTDDAWVWAQLAAARGDAAMRAEALELAKRLEMALAPDEVEALTRRVEGWRPWPQ
jgi:TPR repeat protein